MKSSQSRSRISVNSSNKELCRIEDDYGSVVVTQKGDRRVLSFDSSLEQSSIDMSRPHYLAHEYTQIMLLGLLFVSPKNITILGLGGGGLVHCLHHSYPQSDIQVAELRQSVIDVAYQWFNVPQTEKINIICTDAFEFLKSLSFESTDLILSDLYEAKGMSEVQAQLEFISVACNSLSQQSCLVLNFHHMPQEDEALMKYIKQIFNQVYVCDVFKGNRVVFCCKSNELLDQDQLKLRIKELTQTVEMPLMYYFKQMKILKDF